MACRSHQITELKEATSVALLLHTHLPLEAERSTYFGKPSWLDFSPRRNESAFVRLSFAAGNAIASDPKLRPSDAETGSSLATLCHVFATRSVSRSHSALSVTWARLLLAQGSPSQSDVSSAALLLSNSVALWRAHPGGLGTKRQSLDDDQEETSHSSLATEESLLGAAGTSPRNELPPPPSLKLLKSLLSAFDASLKSSGEIMTAATAGALVRAMVRAQVFHAPLMERVTAALDGSAADRDQAPGSRSAAGARLVVGEAVRACRVTLVESRRPRTADLPHGLQQAVSTAFSIALYGGGRGIGVGFWASGGAFDAGISRLAPWLSAEQALRLLQAASVDMPLWFPLPLSPLPSSDRRINLASLSLAVSSNVAEGVSGHLEIESRQRVDAAWALAHALTPLSPRSKSSSQPSAAKSALRQVETAVALPGVIARLLFGLGSLADGLELSAAVRLSDLDAVRLAKLAEVWNRLRLHLGSGVAGNAAHDDQERTFLDRLLAELVSCRVLRLDDGTGLPRPLRSLSGRRFSSRTGGAADQPETAADDADHAVIAVSSRKAEARPGPEPDTLSTCAWALLRIEALRPGSLPLALMQAQRVRTDFTQV